MCGCEQTAAGCTRYVRRQLERPSAELGSHERCQSPEPAISCTAPCGGYDRDGQDRGAELSGQDASLNRCSGRVTKTGHAFTARSIQVFRIRDGKILLFRDYVNPNALAEALGA